MPNQRAIQDSIRIFKIFEAALWGDKFMLIFLVPFCLAKGLSMTETLILTSINSLAAVIFEIPSGCMADKWNRKNMLFLSASLITFGSLIMVTSKNFLSLSIAWGITGIGRSFHSGANTAFLYDSLLIIKKTNTYAQVFGQIQSWAFYLFMLSALIGGYFFEISPNSPALLNLILFSSILFLPLFLTEPPRKKMEYSHSIKSYYQVITEHIKKHPDLFWISSLGIVLTAVGQTSMFVMQYYLTQLGIVGTLFGLCMAVEYFTRGTIAMHSYKIINHFDIKHTFLIIITLLSIGLILPSFWIHTLAIVFFLFISSARSLVSILKSQAINERIPSEVRATILSWEGMLYRIFYSLLAPIVGFLQDNVNLRVALIFLGICSISSSILLFVKKESHSHA